MSKKTLLNEATVRRFMKLAEMEPLAGNFVNEMFAEEAAVYQDDEGDAAVEDEFAAEEEMEEEPVEGEEEFDVEMDMEEEPVEGEEEAAADAGELTLTDEEAEVFLKVADKVRAAMDAEPAAEELPAPDMGEEELEGDVEMPAEEPAMDEEPPAEEVEVEDEELVQEIARRVARRLVKKKTNKV